LLNAKLHSYIEGLVPDRDSLVLEMENYAKEHHVPIMELAGIEAMLQILRIQSPKRILEIGAAIGYSALRMAQSVKEVKIITIERDPERYQQAEKFLERSEAAEQIILIKGDALEVESQISDLGPFDAIFIDAAKGQYKKFFELYSKYLSDKGIIITDNVLFKGLVCETEIESKRTLNLVKKIDGFNQWLMSNPLYHTIILPVGDGVAISKKRGEKSE
jgi:predicted O-methyltransferase YrrM